MANSYQFGFNLVRNSQEEDKDEEKKGRGEQWQRKQEVGEKEKVESKKGKEGKETIIISRKCGMCETDWLNIRCVLATRSAVQTLKQTVSFKTYS